MENAEGLRGADHEVAHFPLGVRLSARLSGGFFFGLGLVLGAGGYYLYKKYSD